MNKILANSRLLTLFIAIIIVSGISALMSLPRAEDPIIRNRNATITTVLPGATTERVESLVTEKIENQLRQLDEIALITSTSRPGISVVGIELQDTILDSEPVWSLVRDKLTDIEPQLPAGTLSPELDSDHSYAFTMIVALSWDHESEINLVTLRRYAKELSHRLRNLSGTEFVDEYGLIDEEILVSIDPTIATSLKRSAATLSEAIANADAKNAAGRLISPSANFTIEVSDSLDSLDRVKQVPVLVDSNGHVIRLRDIATVTHQPSYPMDEIALTQNHNKLQPNIIIAARMQPQLRVDQWSKKAHQIIEQFQQQLPHNIKAKVLFEQQGYTQQRLSELMGNLLLGFIIILFVLLLTLGARSAFIVALSLPLTSLLTLALMKYTNIPINQMSVTGLIVALGIMVDNAIVMVDTIAHYRHLGAKKIESAYKALRHLWLPLLGSTLTTILAFMPIILMPGAAGEFVGAIALTVSFSLAGSYLIAHTIVAGLAGRFLPKKEPSSAWYHTGITLPSLSCRFEKTLVWSVNHPLKTVLLSLLLPLLGFVGASQLTEQFFPPSERDMFEIQVYLSPQNSIYHTQEFVQQLDSTLHQYSDIKQVQWVVGGNVPSFYYNMVGMQKGANNFAQAMVTASDFNAANRMIKTLQQQLPIDYPQAQILVRKLEQGPPFNAPIELRVQGNDLNQLKQIGEQLRLILAKHPAITETRSTLQFGLPKVAVSVNEEASQLSGLSLTQVAKLLQATLIGQNNGSVIQGQEEIPIRVRVADSQRENLSHLNNLLLPITNENQAIGLPLSAIADLQLEPSLGAITRRNGNRVNTIEGYLIADVLPQTVLNQIEQELSQYQKTLPVGYKIDIGGESAERDESVNNLLANLSLVITLMIMVVVVSFNSFRLSMIIFAVSALAAGLGLLSVWVFQYPFGFTVIIALLGLIGLAINAAIVILSEFKADPAAREGNITAVVSGTMSCTRHITSTTITTVGGFLPLILAGGGFWPPFAVAIAGGTLLTTLLSFYFVPAMYCILVKHRKLTINKKALS
ncbi:efflux RND transporter permease subunit [Photobacterium damselae]|uniref:efflux RND transporter permease subunit n=1 Tax=Photobacterium damselae TaxID=38293 RepID=UPI0012AD584E|nr:efflux RND transporter permease subunit [Photobacterium damselae]